MYRLPSDYCWVGLKGLHGFEFPSAAPQPPTVCLSAIFRKICRKYRNHATPFSLTQYIPQATFSRQQKEEGHKRVVERLQNRNGHGQHHARLWHIVRLEATSLHAPTGNMVLISINVPLFTVHIWPHTVSPRKRGGTGLPAYSDMKESL